MRERKSVAAAWSLRNKDTKVLIHQTVENSPDAFHARVPTSARDARTHVRSGCSAVTFAHRAPRVPWHRPFPPEGGSLLRARSIDRTGEMVLTLATWPFHPRLSSLPSGVPLILTRHALVASTRSTRSYGFYYNGFMRLQLLRVAIPHIECNIRYGARCPTWI